MKQIEGKECLHLQLIWITLYKIQNQHSKLNFDPFQTEVIIKVFLRIKANFGVTKISFFRGMFRYFILLLV